MGFLFCGFCFTVFAFCAVPTATTGQTAQHGLRGAWGALPTNTYPQEGGRAVGAVFAKRKLLRGSKVLALCVPRYGMP
ncbi:MAG: hypothetical protein FWG87_15010, partial [Defluviitaleaceae bacterium]|nr:hypothetical protein [Defluviitaleaceae bacterium]